MTCYYIENCIDSAISWIFPQVNSKDGIYFAMLFTLRERWGFVWVGLQGYGCLSDFSCQNNHTVGHTTVITEFVPAHKIDFEPDITKSDILQYVLDMLLAV